MAAYGAVTITGDLETGAGAPYTASDRIYFYFSTDGGAAYRPLGSTLATNGTFEKPYSYAAFSFTADLPVGTYSIIAQDRDGAFFRNFTIATQDGIVYTTTNAAAQQSGSGSVAVTANPGHHATITDPAGNGDGTVDGTDANETLLGLGGSDRLNGGGGNDRLDGGKGADVMSGGTGDDAYVVGNPSDRVVERSGEGTDTVYSPLSFHLPANVENLFLTGKADIDGTGNQLANRIVGNDGDNALSGLGGNDELRGGKGDDRLDGGTGADLMRGGRGGDTYVVDNAGDRVAEGRGEGKDTVESAMSFRLPANVEKLILTGSADINGAGSNGGNEIFANGGENRLAGFGGNDTLFGNGGGDRLDGGTGIDVLFGGAGNDRLTGGGGKDAFFFDTKLDEAANVDVVTDFTPGKDYFGLDRTIFKGLAGGHVSPVNFQDMSEHAVGPTDRIIYDRANGDLYYDRDGSEGRYHSVKFAHVDGNPFLTGDDFFVV